MKIKLLLFFLLTIVFSISLCAKDFKQNLENSEFCFTVESPVRQHGKIKCQSIILGKSTYLTKLAKIIKYDLDFTDQLDVDLKKSKQKLSPKIQEKLFNKGFSLILYLDKICKSNARTFRQSSAFSKVSSNKQGERETKAKQGDWEIKLKIELKDASSDTTIFEKEFLCDKKNAVYDGHKISDELLPVLTGEKGICLSSLTYCKRISLKHQIICVSDYACKREKTVVAARTVNVAPRWHTKAPILFYSQFTRINNRLMSVDLKNRRHKVICSYDGLNMQPSFSQDGTRAVLCLSGGKNSEIYLYDYALCKKFNKRLFVQLTFNKGNNASPCLLPNNDVIFCSDFEFGAPQIYCLNRKARKAYRLTSGRGYCAAPSYCAKNDSVVYTRALNRVFQLFTLNLDDLEEKQLTFGPGDKHEPAFSECGRFVVFSYDQEYKKGHKTFQIAVLNRHSGNIRVLTTGKEPKTFPRWSKEPFFL